MVSIVIIGNYYSKPDTDSFLCSQLLLCNKATLRVRSELTISIVILIFKLKTDNRGVQCVSVKLWVFLVVPDRECDGSPT